MSDLIELRAEARQDVGKGASRRLRRLAERVPAIIYGAGKDARPITLVSRDLDKALESESFYSQVLALNVEGDTEKVILKDLQRHPARDHVMHADFLRIDESVAIKVHVPIHFLNEETCHGVKMEGGIIQHQETDIEVYCLPGVIPEYIEVDMKDLHVGDSIHLSEVPLPEGVESVALSHGEDYDLALASVMAPRLAQEEEAEALDEEAAAADEGGAAPAEEDESGGDEDEED